MCSLLSKTWPSKHIAFHFSVCFVSIIYFFRSSKLKRKAKLWMILLILILNKQLWSKFTFINPLFKVSKNVKLYFQVWQHGNVSLDFCKTYGRMHYCRPLYFYFYEHFNAIWFQDKKEAAMTVLNGHVVVSATKTKENYGAIGNKRASKMNHLMLKGINKFADECYLHCKNGFYSSNLKANVEEI